ncbi:glutamate receptor 3-like [Dermacentor andersoni]|uniref:glutamate receptor 3-like n=1 Tax=Dermacentor andersoni TaxID=34620 RepID=UPI002155264F|nr:glutamate receptor 3-like [Dermacentor andersoni]
MGWRCVLRACHRSASSWAPLFLLALHLQHQASDALKIGLVMGVNQPQRVVTAFRDVIEYTNQRAPGDRYKITPLTTRVFDNDTFNVTNDACGQLSSGAALLVSPDGGMVLEALAAVSARLQVPLLSASAARSPSSRLTRFGLALRPQAHGALAALVHALRWPRLFYIYDSAEGLDRLQEMLAALPADYPLEVQHVRRIRGEKAAFEFLQERENEQWDTDKFVLLDCSVETARRIVQYAYGKRRAYYTFLYARYTLPDDWKDSQVYDQSKVLALRILHEDASGHHSAVRAASRDSYYSSSESITEEEALAYDATLVVSDMLTRLSRERPELGLELYQDATSGQSSQCYGSPLVPYKHGQAIVELLKKTSVNGTTGQIMFDEQGQRVGYTVDVMELTMQHKMQKIGYWSQATGFIKQPDSRGYQPTWVDPSEKKLVVTTILEPPFLMYKNANDTSDDEDNLEGYCKDLIAKLMRAMGRQYSIRLVKDNKYGSRDKSAQSGWNGMIGEILRKEADIAVAPLTITAERSRAVYFSEPFMQSGLAVLARRHEAESLSVFSVFSFLRPLSWEVWLCLLSAYVAVAVLLFVINRLNLAVATPPKAPPGPCSHLYNSLWYALGAFMSEECNNCRPKSVGSRLISFGWWLFVLVMLSMYTAQLWVNQPFRARAPSVKDVKELAMQDKVEYGIVRDSATEEFFRRTKDTYYERMWDSMATFNNTMTATNEEGVKRVRESEGNYAFIVDTMKIKYATQKAPCDLVQIGDTFQPSGYGVVVSHKSPLKKILDVTIARLQEDGELYAVYKKWFGKEECQQPEQGAVPLEVTKVGGWFVILGAGLVIAVAVAVAEVWCKSPAKPKKEKKPKEPKEPKPKKEKKKKDKKEKDDEQIKEEGVETQLLQPGTNPSAYTGGYVGGADLTIEEVGEEEEEDEVVKVPIADVENLTDSADDSRDITRDVTADRIVPLAVNPLENHPEIKSIDHSPVESPKGGGGYESSEV